MPKAYKMIGITDEVTSCDCCGRTDLKRTIVLEREENGVIVYFGSQCGARAVGWKTKDFERVAKNTQAERRKAIWNAYQNHPASVERNQMVKEHYDNGGTWQTAPWDVWRQLDQQARDETLRTFNASPKELSGVAF